MIDYIYIESMTTLRNLKQIDYLSFLAVDNSRGNISVNEIKVSCSVLVYRTRSNYPNGQK